MCQTREVARLTRDESKARTRQRLMAEAERLFAERGYAATSLEQIAQAAEVTKGAIYGHFESKEDLLLSAIEAAPSPSYPGLGDVSRPLPDRLEELGRQMVAQDRAIGTGAFAARLEFIAALLRNDSARSRYAADLFRRLAEYAAADPDQPRSGTTALEVWLIGTAVAAGLQLYGLLMPDVFDADLRAKAMALLVCLYPEAAEPPQPRTGS